MQNSDREPAPSFSQQGYLVADSLYYTSRALFMLFIGVMFYVLLGVYVAYTVEEIEFFKFWLLFITIIFSPIIIWYYFRARIYGSSDIIPVMVIKDWYSQRILCYEDSTGKYEKHVKKI